MNKKQQIKQDFEEIVGSLAITVTPDFFNLSNDVHSIEIKNQKKNIRLPFYFSVSLNSATDIG